MKTLILVSLLFLVSCKKETTDPCTYGNTQYPDAPAPYDVLTPDDRVFVGNPQDGVKYVKYIYNCFQHSEVELVFTRDTKDGCWKDPVIEYNVCK